MVTVAGSAPVLQHFWGAGAETIQVPRFKAYGIQFPCVYLTFC
jgi:hypothetical protein